MPELNLNIKLDNAAWRTDADELDLELIGDALQGVANALWSGCTEGPIIEINGNQTGEWSITQ